MINCPNCTETFGNRDNLLIHFKSVHSHESIKCKTCDLTFIRLKPYLSHDEKIHQSEGRILRCDICEKGFALQGDLKKHIDSNHANYELACEICGVSLRNKSKLHVHKREVHSESKEEKCDQCYDTFQSKHMLGKHIRYKHSNTVLTCEICEYCCTSNVLLKSHLKNVHEKVNKDYPCEFCSKVFSTGRGLKFHIKRVHKATKDEECRKCGIFVEYLSYHEKLVHYDRKVGNEKVACEICGKVFSHKSFLYRHQKKVHMNLNLPCDKCAKTFKSSFALYQHNKRIHEERQEWTCEYCQKVFITSQGKDD